VPPVTRETVWPETVTHYLQATLVQAIVIVIPAAGRPVTDIGHRPPSLSRSRHAGPVEGPLLGKGRLATPSNSIADTECQIDGPNKDQRV
jgi:hypothetical protein